MPDPERLPPPTPPIRTPHAEWFDRSELDRWLRSQGHDCFADSIAALCAARLDRHNAGELDRWATNLAALPSPHQCHLDLDHGVRVVASGGEPPASGDALREQLMAFHPWRKGPLEFLDLLIDTEWRSDWKWNRFADAIDWRGQTILDVGCGNGYYGWRMLGAGADRVVGLDPIMRYVMQFEVFNRYAASPKRHDVLPMVDTDLPEKLSLFDVAVSAGVLYHRTSPIDHLRSLAAALKPGGKLLLETLIIEADDATLLCPEDRYGQMRNVWFLPSIAMLTRWMRRTGYVDIDVVDVTATSIQEQRSTDWMTFQSLIDFLEPTNHSKTIEGYPGPVRASLVATKG